MSDDCEQKSDATEDARQTYHIVFLHEKLRQRYEDVYMIDLANALLNFGHRVTIFTSYFDEENALDDVHPISGQLPVAYSASWIPNSVCGMFRRTLIRIRAACMAFRVILFPPQPRPKIVILDTDTIALFILSWFSNYKTIYVQHFPQLRYSDFFHCSMQVTSDLVTSKTLRYADEIIVQTRRLHDIFRRSFPNIPKYPLVLHPCVDTGLWSEAPIDIKRIIPDLPKDCILFVSFGEYKKRSNFKLILDALEHIFAVTTGPLREKLHMVIAGHCSERSLEQKMYREELILKIAGKSYASQVTFLKQLPTVHQKTLLDACTAVVHPTRHDIYPGPVLAAMSMGRTIIAVNCGFPLDILMHRITGILVEPDPHKFAQVMVKLATSPTLQSFIGEMSRNTFSALYSFDSFSRALNNVVVRHVDSGKYDSNK